MLRKLVYMAFLCVGMSMSPNTLGWIGLIAEAQEILSHGNMYLISSNSDHHDIRDIRFAFYKPNSEVSEPVFEFGRTSFAQYVGRFNNVAEFIEQYSSDHKSATYIGISFSHDQKCKRHIKSAAFDRLNTIMQLLNDEIANYLNSQLYVNNSPNYLP
jgi:hypothetical protein